MSPPRDLPPLASERAAHDLKNLLTIVMGATEALSMDACDGDPKAVALAGLEAARRAKDMLQRFLKMATAASGEEASCSTEDVLRSISALGAQLLPNTVRLAVHPSPRPLSCRADRRELENALLNLCKNAGEACLAGGSVILSVASVMRAPVGDGGGARMRYVRFDVQDDGVGMSPEILRLAGRPGFTAKAESGGTGLGLHSVAAFAQAAGGTLQIKSRPGRGTLVSLWLQESGDREDLH